MTSLTRAAILIALCGALIFSIFQTAEAQEKQALTETRKLAVEVVDGTQRGIRSPVAENKGGFDGGYTQFGPPRRIPGWKQPEGALPLITIKLRSWREGEFVRIEVAAVFSDSLPADAPGPKYGEREQSVASYLAREGETVGVNELKQFGVEPFELKVVLFEPEPEGQPIPAPRRVVNRLKSVEVVSFAKQGSYLERGRLRLLNVSSKNIIALEINVPEQGLSHTAQAAPARSLMQPGSNYETEINLGRSWSESPQAGLEQPPDALVIGTVLFDDGSYEGDVKVAARIAARQKGRLTQFERILKLLQNFFDAQGQDAPDIVEQFKSQVAGLRIDAEPSSVDALLAKFPELPKSEGRQLIASDVLGGLRAGREETLYMIGNVESKPTQKATETAPRLILEDIRRQIEKRAGSRRNN